MNDIKDELTDLQEQVNDNTLRLERITSKDWYSNKQLFEMMQSMEERLDKFNKNFHKYNGLIEEREKDRELLEELHERVDEIETTEEVKQEQATNYREWIGWAVATALAIMKILEFLGGD